MNAAPPDHDRLYRALLDRDERFAERAFVCVTTTGVFCRLTCPARKPRSANCVFKPTAADCLAAGYRACRRCRPLAAATAADPTVARLLSALQEAPERRWTEAEIGDLGLDPSTARRAFKRAFGETFLSVARRRRLAAGFGTLAAGGKVIEAQLDAGFASPSAFRVAFARLVGRAPGDLPKNAALRADRIETPLGDMIAVGDDARLHLLEFLDRKALPRELAALVRSAKGALGLGRSSAADRARAELDAYFAGRLERFETPLAPAGTPFQTKVWKALTSIPVGETLSYGDLARRLSRPEAHRAVAAANGANRIAIMIPCHRLVGADGALTGYGGGLWRKRRLLEMESARARAPEEETP